jgi:DNA-binding NarL/FixJ family response regulator
MDQLTPRERDVISQICAGLSNKGIARVLGISEGTVKIHLHNLYCKLEIGNRTTLAMWWQATKSPPVGAGGQGLF